MKAINQLIRKEIDYSYKMKEINKDRDIPKETSLRIYEEIQAKDKKIKFLQELSKTMKEVENEKNKKKHLCQPRCMELGNGTSK